MRRKIAIALVWLLANGLHAQLRFESDRYNFGKVSAGTPIEHDFTFTNIGPKTQEISSVEPSCDCLKIESWSSKVDPGQTGHIRTKLDTSHVGTGLLLRAVTITSNAKEQMVMLFGEVWNEIEVELLPERATGDQFKRSTFEPDNGGVLGRYLAVPGIALYPKTLSLFAKDGCTSAGASLSLTNHFNTHMEVLQVTADNPALTVSLRTNQLGKAYLVAVTAAVPLNTQQTTGQLTILTSSTNNPIITIGTFVSRSTY